MTSPKQDGGAAVKFSNVLKGMLVLVILPLVIIAFVFQQGVLRSQPKVSAEADQLEEPAPLGGAPIHGEKVSFETAQARLSWAVPLPTYTINDARIVETWASYEDVTLKERQVYLIYSNGLEISIGHQAESPDYAAAWEEPFRNVTVRGHPGIGKDPGTQEVEGHGEQKYSGSVTWWANGLALHIYGDYPLAELLKVAESMPEPVWFQESQ